MTGSDCPRETTVLRAVRLDAWSDDLRAHLASCPACAEAALVAAALLAEAQVARDQESLPDASRIWLDARLRARRLQVARVTRPIALLWWVAAACATALAVIAAPWMAPHLGRWAAALRPPALDLVSGLGALHGLIFLAAGAGFLGLAGYALVTAWREGDET